MCDRCDEYRDDADLSDEELPEPAPEVCQICGAQDGDRTLAGGVVEVEDDMCRECWEKRPSSSRRPRPSYRDEDVDWSDNEMPF